MRSVTAEKKVVRVGTSDSITVTRDISQIGVSAGERVNVRISVPSDEVDDMNHMLDLISTGEYVHTNRDWVHFYPDDDWYLPAKPGDDIVARMDSLEDLHKTVHKVLHGFILDRVVEPYVGYDDGIGSFVRSIQNLPNEPSLPDRLEEELLFLDFISELFVNSDLMDTKLLATFDVFNTIEKVRSMYNDILAQDVNIMDACIDALNVDFHERQKALNMIVGHYVVITSFFEMYRNGNIKEYLEPEVQVRHTYSLDSLEKIVDAEFSSQELESASMVGHESLFLGPMDEGPATSFAQYIVVAIGMHSESLETSRLFEWCNEQYERFIEINKSKVVSE